MDSRKESQTDNRITRDRHIKGNRKTDRQTDRQKDKRQSNRKTEAATQKEAIIIRREGRRTESYSFGNKASECGTSTCA